MQGIVGFGCGGMVSEELKKKKKKSSPSTSTATARTSRGKRAQSLQEAFWPRGEGRTSPTRTKARRWQHGLYTCGPSHKEPSPCKVSFSSKQTLRLRRTSSFSGEANEACVCRMAAKAADA